MELLSDLLLQNGYVRDTRFVGDPFVKRVGDLEVWINEKPDGYRVHSLNKGVTQVDIFLGKEATENSMRVLKLIEEGRVVPDRMKWIDVYPAKQ